ncbi:MAG: hypothetical protein Q4C42_04105 [Clostridia bacterium]|nr:hypothetical protein [Clostridia bacterium]
MEEKNYIKEAVRRTRRKRNRKAVIFIVIFALVIFLITYIIGMVSEDTIAQSTESVKDAVIRSAVQCYSVEGMYPSGLDYLEEHYGLTLNHEDYIVSYEAYSSNLMPDVTVLIKGQ